MNARILLVISVVVNMLLAGMLFGHMSHHYVVASAAPFDQAVLLRQLPPDKKSLFDTIIVPARQKMDDDHRQIDDAKAKAVQMLQSDDFNRTAYLQQVRRINDLHVKMKTRMAEAVAELALQYTPAERAVLATIISHPPYSLPPGAMVTAPAKP